MVLAGDSSRVEQEGQAEEDLDVKLNDMRKNMEHLHWVCIFVRMQSDRPLNLPSRLQTHAQTLLL